MHGLLPYLLSGALFLALEWMWCRPSRRRPASGASGRRGSRPAPRPPSEGDPFALPLVRRRLCALAAELQRLEGDPTVFAKAFHTYAAQAAYDALLADAARLEDTARLEAVRTLEMEITCSRGGLREELEV